MIRKLIKEEDGAFSIVSIVVVLIMVLAITAFTDIVNKSFILNEVQGHMDTAGITALQNSINMTRLRAEQLATDNDNLADTEDGTLELSDYKDKIKKSYDKELRKRIKINPNITSIKQESILVDFTYDNWGFGTTSSKRPQIVLDATYKITIRASSQFDKITPIAKQFYSARQSRNFSVSYNGRDDDGNIELIIRSVTREAYR